MQLEYEDHRTYDNYIDVSVIVPVFRVEQYIRRCLDSLRAQTFENVEFLLIDDGSPDNSGHICEEYADMDSRFKVFHKANGGLSSARNYGIAKARGEYLMFVDSDDWVSPDFCAIAFSLVKDKDVELAMFAHQHVNESTVLLSSKTNLEEGFKTWQEGIELMLSGYGVYAWNKIYKRTLFDGINYPEGRLFEDQPVTWQLIYKANKIYCTNHVLYYYFMRSNSIIHQRSVKAIRDKFEMKLRLYDGLEGKGYSSTLLEQRKKESALYFVVSMNPEFNDVTYDRARLILQNKPAVPVKLDWKRRFLINMFLRHKKLFDFVCSVPGRRVK